MTVDDKGIKDSWKEYMEKLMNDENEWDHKISAEVKEGPADCIRMAEVRAVLKKMKKRKAPGLSGLVAEMIQATWDIGSQWILDLCNGITKEGSIPEDWKSSVVLPIYKGKGVWIVQSLTLLVGRQEGHPACKKIEWWGAGMVICLELGADLHMARLMPLPLTVSCFSKIQIGFTFLVPAHPGSPGQRGR